MKWVAVVLIIGPVLLFMLLGAAVSKTADGGLVLLVLAPLFVIPIVTGLLIGAVQASLFLARTREQPGRHPVKTVLSAIFIIFVVLWVGGIAASYVYYKVQHHKSTRFFTVNQQQAMQLITSCKIDSLSQEDGQKAELDFSQRDKAATTESDKSGVSFYMATGSNWDALVNAANEASRKCGFIEADSLKQSFTWISTDEARRLLLACKVQDTHGYFDGIYQNYGKDVIPTGKKTGIAVLNSGNSDQLYMVGSILPLMKDAVNNAQQKCGIDGLTDVYMP